MDMVKVLKGMNPNAMLESWACDIAIPTLKVTLFVIAACESWLLINNMASAFKKFKVFRRMGPVSCLSLRTIAACWISHKGIISGSELRGSVWCVYTELPRYPNITPGSAYGWCTGTGSIA